MNQRLALSTLIVSDYDTAIDFFIKKLKFSLIEDTTLDDSSKRWVVVSPNGDDAAALLLARASGDTELAAIGNQTGGRVAFFLYTDDFWRDFETYKSKGVTFVREPEKQAYGTVAVFEDVSGNLWDLIERTTD